MLRAWPTACHCGLSAKFTKPRPSAPHSWSEVRTSRPPRPTISKSAPPAPVTVLGGKYNPHLRAWTSARRRFRPENHDRRAEPEDRFVSPDRSKDKTGKRQTAHSPPEGNSRKAPALRVLLSEQTAARPGPIQQRQAPEHRSARPPSLRLCSAQTDLSSVASR